MIARFGSEADAMGVFGVVKRSPFVLPLACVAAVAMVFISEASYWRSVGMLDDLDAMGTARSSIQELAQGVLDAESGQRGYLLTGRKEYLRPYQGALKSINQAFNDLDRYYGAKPESRDLLLRLHELTQTKLSELSETIRVQDEGRTDLATELVLSDIGKEKMEAMRALGAQLLARETLNLAASRADVYRTLMLSRFGVALLTACSLLALTMYLRQRSALEQQQREQQVAVQAERDRLEMEVQRRTAQLTELTRHLQTAREDERSRLARDLHDELGALLTSAKLDAARIRSRLADTAPEAQERLAHLVGTLNSGIALKRRIIEDLRPSALSNLGLVATLEILAREFAEQSGVQVHRDLSPVALDADAELVVYRLVQEAITNTAKYAHARQVWISLSSRDGQVEIGVRDDGVGFDTSVQSSSAHGLLGMRYRVESEGGTVTVDSAPGRGTRIAVTLPESNRGDPSDASRGGWPSAG
jgi:signal transduction histidine kinase